MLFNYKWIFIVAIIGFFSSSLMAHEAAKLAGRTLQSASEFDYPPFAVTRKDGSAGGFSVDLLKAVVTAQLFGAFSTRSAM